jgi:hypothetical protein
MASGESLYFGSGTIIYPTTPSAGWGNIVGKGSTSDFRIAIQDGTGRVNMYWNAYYDASAGAHKYIVSNEGANRLLIHSGDFGFYVAPAGTAGNAISWKNAMYITNSGNVGIGTTTPAYKLDVAGDIRTTGCLVYNGGTLGTCVSDIRLKENIQNLTFTNPLEKVLNLQPKKFTFKNDTQEITGLIAQEVEQIAPELVTSDENGYRRIKYGYIQWLLLEAIKEQQKQIDQLQKENQELKNKLNNLESRVAILEARIK